MRRLQRAAAIAPTSKIYELMGLLYGEMQMSEQAGAALETAVKLDPNSVTAHRALALWYEFVANLPAAEREYRRALSLDAHDSHSRLSLIRVQALESR